MEHLIALLVLWFVIAVVFGLAVASFLLLAGLVRGPRRPPARRVRVPVPWTDDEEIAARHHH